MTDAPDPDTISLIDEMEADARENASQPVDATKIEDQIERALRIEDEIAALEEEIKAKKKDLKTLMENTLPEFMTELGLSEFGVDSGARVKLSLGGYGSLRYAPDRDAAIAYLEENGLKGAVTTEISVKFTEEEREAARTLAETLTVSNDKAVSIKRDINPSTLRAYALRRKAEDPHFDPGIIGMTVFTTAALTRRPKQGTTING